MATRPRENLLRCVSIPSIARQILSPAALVIVSDLHRLTGSTEQELQTLLPRTKIHSISNSRDEGAAGTWNTGLNYIYQRWPEAYVAILDDDDAWDNDHLIT